MKKSLFLVLVHLRLRKEQQELVETHILVKRLKLPLLKFHHLKYLRL